MLFSYKSLELRSRSSERLWVVVFSHGNIIKYYWEMEKSWNYLLCHCERSTTLATTAIDYETKTEQRCPLLISDAKRKYSNKQVVVAYSQAKGEKDQKC